MIPRIIPRAWIEYMLAAIGVTCLAYYGMSTAHASAFQRAGREALTHTIATGDPALAGGIVGLLDVPRLSMSVAVVEGEDPGTLMHAAGHLAGTALPWESGNTAVAAHRDTFFRPLRDVRVGDDIRFVTARGTFAYRVQETRIVMPDDVSVLLPTTRPALTLVTCYPFSFLGAAPKRFIVRAERLEDYNHEHPGGVHATSRPDVPPVPRRGAPHRGAGSR